MSSDWLLDSQVLYSHTITMLPGSAHQPPGNKPGDLALYLPQEQVLMCHELSSEKTNQLSHTTTVRAT